MSQFIYWRIHEIWRSINYSRRKKWRWFLKFEVQFGEDEGKNIPHFHLDNGEIEKKKKKTAIRLDMPNYNLLEKDYKDNT